MSSKDVVKQIKELREITGFGMMECKKALHYAQGDFKEALKYLQTDHHRGFGGTLVTPARTGADNSVPAWIATEKIREVKQGGSVKTRVVVWFDDEKSAELFAAGLRVATKEDGRLQD